MAPLRVAEIVAVGSELLTPHRTDSNSLFLTARLNEIGIAVVGKRIVGDVESDVRDAIALAVGRADLVLVTGGLGPTADDVTREATAAALERPLEEDATLVAALRERFASRNLSMPENNRRQAQVPRGAVAIENPLGTAPGIWIETGEKLVILLPGPPRELQPMVEALIETRLGPRAHGRRLRRRVIKLTGRPESLVDEAARPVYEPLQRAAVPIDTTILAAPGQIELQLSAAGEDVAAVDRALDQAVESLASALTPWVFSTDGSSLEAVVGHGLRARGWTIAAAESCTAGLLLARLTDVPGSSAWVLGGTIVYADDAKIRELGVAAETLERHGAVSEPVARAMAEGIRSRFGASLGVAVTGIAGPSGGSPEKPVGTVVIAVAALETVVRTYRFPGDRAAVRQHSTAAALDLVRRELT